MSEEGVVTFVDVLGWKGIYNRTRDPITTLKDLIADLRGQADDLRGREVAETVVRSISDTIVLFTRCRPDKASDALNVHGELCRWLIPEALTKQLPVRGATSFGEFDEQDNIFVGKAVDEAASWHEQGDWIGVHLTPSAEFVFQTPGEGIWRSYAPPLKSRMNWQTHCVDWSSAWRKKGMNMKGVFRDLGPILPELAGKFVNTLAFVDEESRETE